MAFWQEFKNFLTNNQNFQTISQKPIGDILGITKLLKHNFTLKLLQLKKNPFYWYLSDCLLPVDICNFFSLQQFVKMVPTRKRKNQQKNHLLPVEWDSEWFCYWWRH